MIRNTLKSIPALVLLSLLIHTLVFSGASLLSYRSPAKNSSKNVEIVILPSTPSKLEKTRQIVEQSKKAINDIIPDKNYALGEHSQKVNKQTRAKKVGDFTNQVQAGQKQPIHKNTTRTKPKKKLAKNKRSKTEGSLPTLSELTPQFNVERKYGQVKKNTPGKESQTSNHLKEIDTGLQTLLSTREFVYFSYYQRIRSKIRQIWEPLIRHKVRKVFEQGRTIASARDRITKVVIILNEGGHLIRVQVIGESGVTDLDEAAVEAFRAAEPFPNPPDGIVEGDGTIKIRWDFILEA